MEIFNSNFIVDNKEKYKNLNILKDLTIVIPIRNEAFDDVLFAVEYYSLLERNILIIDGSIDELPHLGKQNNLHYIHKKDTNIHDRIKYSLNRIKTKYILLVALDDFVILDSIIEGLELINKYNCEYVTGPAISYHHSDKSIYNIFSLDSKLKIILRKLRHYFVKKSIDVQRLCLLSEHKRIRMYSLMVMYNLPILFGLYRRDTMVKLFQKVTLNQFNNLNYVEILASLFLSEKGKIYITKSNFLYRSVRVGTGSSKENHTINLVKKQADYTDINFLRIAFDAGWLISYHQIAFTLYRFNTSIYLFLRKLFNLVK